MALNDEQIETIKVLVQKGGLSNRQIAKEVPCSESAVRTAIKKYDIKKNALIDLAKAEISSTLEVNKIKTQKNALNNAEQEAYNEVFISLSHHLNLFNSSTIENQLLANQAGIDIKKEVEDKNNTITAIDHLPNIMAITKITEANRKQLYGNTETYIPKKQDDEDTPTQINIVRDT